MRDSAAAVEISGATRASCNVIAYGMSLAGPQQKLFVSLHDVDEQDRLPAGKAHQYAAPQSRLPLLIFPPHGRLPPASRCHTVEAAPPAPASES